MLTGIDYLDENSARISSEPLSLQGQRFRIPIDHAKLIQIHNLKPRTSPAGIAMQLRVHFDVDDRDETFTIPTIMEPGFKQIGNATTYFMRLIG
jgi:hypothetical protein